MLARNSNFLRALRGEKMTIQGNGKSSHPDRHMVVAYVAGTCSSKEKEVIEHHCLDCLTCRAQLATLLRLSVTLGEEDEQRDWAPLLPLGQQASAQAREIIKQERRQDLSFPSWWSGSRKKLQGLRPTLKPVLIIGALLASISVIYFAWWFQSSDERLLARVRDLYNNTRTIQARVTGGLAHQNYVVARGPGDHTGVDESQRVTLLAELNQKAQTSPTAATRHILGRFFMLQGELDPAEQQLLLALKERPRDARLHADLGALYYERSRKKGHEDRELLEKAAEYSSNAVENDPKLPEAWFNRALCYEQMNLFLQAESDWKQYLTLDSSSAWAEEAREHLNKLRERAEHLEKLEQNVQAEFQTAEATGDEIKMRDLVTRHFVPVQNLAMDQLFDKYLAAAIVGEVSQTEQFLRTLRHIGQLISEIKGDRFVADAVDFVARGNLAVKRQVQATRQTLQQAKLEHKLGALGAASDIYSKAIQASERLGDHCHAEIAAFAIARYYDPQSESQEVFTLRNRLVIDTARRRHRQMHARALLALANAEGASQRISHDLAHSMRAIETAKELGDAETTVNSLRFAGGAYSRQGDYDSAISELYEAISFMRNFPVAPGLAFVAYDEMGDTLIRMASYVRALPYQREAVQMAEIASNAMLLANMIGKLGLSYGMLDRDEDAKVYLNDAVARAEAITDRKARLLLQVDLYTKFGDFYLRQNKISEAIATYQRAIENIGSGGNRFYLSAIRQGLAKAYLSQGKYAEAEAELKESIRLTEEAREQISDARGRSSFLASQQSIYRAMVSFQFLNKHDPGQSFNYAEIAKSRDLLDALTGLSEVRAGDGQVKLSLSHSATPLTLEQVQQALPTNSQLVQYFVGEKYLMIWLVTRDQLTVAKSDVSGDDLRRKVTTYLEELRARGNLEELNRRANDLYHHLIAPIAERLDRNRALCIIPDGVLQHLPFAALISPEPQRYLIESFTLVINPSASVLARTLDISRDKQRSESEPFLGLSNPRFDQQRFPKLPVLPSSDQELERIRSYYPQHLILSHRQATESAFANQISSYEIVHLAAHALSNKQSSLLSTIVLADEIDSAEKQGPGNVAFDGALHAHEVYRLKLDRTRLVVLSNCRSGLSDQTRGEALSGLAQAFLVAGVPTVIASLWDIDDKSTAELMEKFHAAHRVKKLAFGQALRQAQLSFLQTAPPRRRHPYYWATFIVTGDGLVD